MKPLINKVSGLLSTGPKSILGIMLALNCTRVDALRAIAALVHEDKVISRVEGEKELFHKHQT